MSRHGMILIGPIGTLPGLQWECFRTRVEKYGVPGPDASRGRKAAPSPRHDARQAALPTGKLRGQGVPGCALSASLASLRESMATLRDRPVRQDLPPGQALTPRLGMLHFGATVGRPDRRHAINLPFLRLEYR
jgi:hypothetical protein